MKVFRIERNNGTGCVTAEESCSADHWSYVVAGHAFNRRRFERLTGCKWERGYRTFRLVEVTRRTKRQGKRG